MLDTPIVLQESTALFLLEGSSHLVFVTVDTWIIRKNVGFLNFLFVKLGHVSLWSETLKLYFVVEFKLTHCLSDAFRWRPLRCTGSCSWLPIAMILKSERIPLLFCHFISFCISTAVVCWMLQSKLTNEARLLSSWEQQWDNLYIFVCLQESTEE